MKFSILNFQSILKLKIISSLALVTATMILLFYPIQASAQQVIDPAVWQNGSVGLQTTSNSDHKTGGLGLMVQLNGSTSWPLLQLYGSVYEYYGHFTSNLGGVDLGNVKITSVTPTSNNETSDWSYDTISVNSNALSLTVSRLSPAILINNPAANIRLFSGNLANGATITGSTITNRNPAPASPRWVAYSSDNTIRIQQIPNATAQALPLPALDGNWIMVWYGSNSYFIDTKKPTTYHITEWMAGAVPNNNNVYQADAPMLFTFANNPSSIRQTDEGGIDLTFGSTAGNISVLPLFGREHPSSTATEGWGTTSTLPPTAINKINFWASHSCFFPSRARETYGYNNASDTVTISENITFTKVCPGGIQYAPLPTFLALARNNLGITFSGPVVDAQNTATEFGPIQGIENTNTYIWSISGLKKYTDYQRVLTNTGAPPQDLVNDLSSEVNKLFDANGNPIHLTPWFFSDRVPQNLPGGDVYFANPADTLYHLSEVYPALPESSQTRLVNYLRSERTNFPPESVYDLNPTQGTSRGDYSIDPALDNGGALYHSLYPFMFQRRVPLYSFLGLARYYNLTGDTVSSSVITATKTALDNEMKEQDFATMYWFKGFDDRIAATQNSNRLFAGLVGATQLFKRTGDTDENLVRALLAKAAVNRIAQAAYPRYLYSSGLIDLANLNPNWQAASIYRSDYGYIFTYNWTGANDDPRQVAQLSQLGIYLHDSIEFAAWEVGKDQPYLFGYRDMIPELARLLSETAKADVLIYFNKYTETMKHWYYPFSEAILGAEHNLNFPIDSYQLFMADALIQGDTAENLARYTAFPQLATGDLFYINKLAETIKAYQGWVWEDELAGVTPTSTPVACALTSASWSSVGPMVEGTSVNLTVNTSGDCNGKNIEIKIFDDDGSIALNDEIATLPQVVVTGNPIQTSWVTTYVADADDPADLLGDRLPEYFFEARVVGESGFTNSPYGAELVVTQLPIGGPSPTPTGIISPTTLPTSTPSATLTPISTPSATLSPTPAPVACSLASAAWSAASSPVTAGTPLTLTVNTTSNCDGSNAYFTIRHDRPIIEDIDALNQPAQRSIAINSNVAQTNWTAAWENGCISPITCDPNLYFTASINGTGPTIESSQPSSTNGRLIITQASGGPVISSITDNQDSYPNSQVPKYEKLEVTFNVNNTTATNLQMPYDPNPPAGVTPGVGVTVNAELLPPGQTDWNSAFKQPAFYYQDFDYQVKGGRDWIYPKDQYSWKVRFSPTQEGVWQYRLTAQDSSGTTTSTANTFTVTTSSNKGFIKVSDKDKRYFEYEDGTYFPGLGYNMNFDRIDWNNPVLSNQANFQAMNQNGIQLIRHWLSQWAIFGSQDNPWRSANNGSNYDALIINRPADVKPGSDSSMEIKWSTDLTVWAGNPCMFLGWMKNTPAVKPNTSYHVKINYYLRDNLVGPKVANQPYGLVAKLGGWVTGDFSLPADWPANYQCAYPSALTPASFNVRTITPYINTASSGWTNLEADFTTASGDFLPMLYLAMENINPTNGITNGAFIDSVEIKENLGGGQFGPNIVNKPLMSHLQYFDQDYSYRFDKVMELAKQNNIYLKLVALEKNETTQNMFGYDGNPAATFSNNNFYGNWRNMTKVRWLQQSYWRYLQARWGYSTNIHSWELLNEGDPYNGLHYSQADEFAKYMKCGAFGLDVGGRWGETCSYNHPNNHLVTTSFWNSFPKNEFWANADYPNLDYTDVHQYVLSTDTANFNDTAQSTLTVSNLYGAKQPGGVNKPVMRGETGFVTGSTDGWNHGYFDNDTDGIWLHKYTWGQINPGGLIESYWYDTQHIYPSGRDLRPVFGTYYNFIKDIPLSNGNYVDAQATSTNTNLRAWGQKDPVLGRAHLWIDNRTHTWNNVVNNPSAVTPQSGTVSFTGMPIGNYTVTWVNTYTGGIDRTETINSTDGNISFNITNLATDTAVKVENTTLPSVTPVATSTPVPTPTLTPTNTPTPTTQPTATPSATLTSTPSATLTPPVGGGECGLETASALWSTTSTPENTSVSLTVKGNGIACIGQSVEFNIRRNIDIGFDEDITKLTASFNDQLISTTTWTTPAWFDSCGGIDPRTCDPIYHFDALTGTNSQRSNDLTVTDYTPTASTDWPQVQKDPQHTGYSSEVLGTNFQVDWTYPFQPDRVYPQTQAIIYQGKVFVGTEGANGKSPRMIALYAGSKAQDPRAGTVAWEFVADGPILNSAAADNGMVYFATLQGSVYALDMDGGEVWKRKVSQRLGFVTASVIADNKVLIGGQDGYFYALNPNDGEVVWRYNTNSPILMTAAYNNNHVYVTTMDMRVYALNTSPTDVGNPSTILVWRSDPLAGLIFKDYWPVVTGGRIFIRPMYRNTTNFYSIDEANGSIDTSLSQDSVPTMHGAPTPPCVLSDGSLIKTMVRPDSWMAGWGILDLPTKSMTYISKSYLNGGEGNADENVNVSCSNNLVLTFHTQEQNAHFTGFYNLEADSWTQIYAGHRNRQMSSNTQGGGGNPPSISNGIVYHISWHELIMRTTN